MSASGRVYFVGLGLEPREHASVESLVALGECRRVFHEGLERDDLAALKPFCRRGALTAARGPRWIASAAGAAARGESVAFATLGHPFYAGASGAALAAACDARRVPWTSFGAVSPMGVALSRAGVTLGTNVWGLQAFEHRAFVSATPVPNAAWPTALYFLSGPDRKSTEACARRLAEFFPADHECLWCSGPREGEKTTVAALSRDRGVSRRAVLYLPAAREATTPLGRTGAAPRSGPGPDAGAWVKP